MIIITKVGNQISIQKEKIFLNGNFIGDSCIFTEKAIINEQFDAGKTLKEPIENSHIIVIKNNEIKFQGTIKEIKKES